MDTLARSSWPWLLAVLTIGCIERSERTPLLATHLSARFNSACAVADGQVYCWGSILRVFSDDEEDDSATWGTPVRIPGIDSATAVGVGGSHACVLTRDDRVYCWGQNAWGQLGDGTTSSRSTPARVEGVRDVAQIAVGRRHSCALIRDGRVACWGSNEFGELTAAAGGFCCTDEYESPTGGRPACPCSPQPAWIAELTDVVEIGVAFGVTCARSAARGVFCWGLNLWGIAGRVDEPSSPRLSPIDLPAGVRQLAVGDSHACALLDSGEAQCWGLGRAGQLGSASAHLLCDRAARCVTPIAVDGLRDAVALAADAETTCALRSGGAEVLCWGSNWSGQLLGHDEPILLTPQPIALPDELGEVASIDVGDRHACVLARSGRVFCWGNNEFGQLGTGRVSEFGPPTSGWVVSPR